MAIVLPLALGIIFLLLYFQFRSPGVTLMVFSGVFVAWGGGFLMLWLYGQAWFLDATPFGIDLRELFQIRRYNLSVAVWVGFLALFGIATDNGVVMATRIKQSFEDRRPSTIEGIRLATIDGARRRLLLHLRALEGAEHADGGNRSPCRQPLERAASALEHF